MDLRHLEERGIYKLSVDDLTKRFYIARETSESKSNPIERDFFKVYFNGHLDLKNSKKYEVLELSTDISELFAKALFDFIVQLNKSIKNSIEDIEAFLISDYIIDLQKARGLFAELYAIKKFDLSISHENSIYDFRKDDGDVEVKSVSRNQSSVKISLQQATNNFSAKVYCFEVLESSKGLSVKDLLSVNSIRDKRYNWLINSKSKFLDVKFIVSRETFFVTGDIFQNMEVPENVLSADFQIKINFV